MLNMCILILQVEYGELGWKRPKHTKRNLITLRTGGEEINMVGAVNKSNGKRGCALF